MVHFVDKTGRSPSHAALDARVSTGDILIVERQAILRLLECIQRVAPIISLFNNTATAVNTVRDWVDSSQSPVAATIAPPPTRCPSTPVPGDCLLACANI